MPKPIALANYTHPFFEQLFIAIHAEVTWQGVKGCWGTSRQWVAENPFIWGDYCTRRANACAEAR